MNIVNWDPFVTIRELQRAVNDVFSDNLERSPKETFLTPPVDIYLKDEKYFLEMSLPGVKKESVDISHADGQLRIFGEIEGHDDDEKIRYYKKERASGKFERKFQIDDRIAPDSIKACFENGVLTLEIPEPKEVKPEIKKIQIN